MLHPRHRDILTFGNMAFFYGGIMLFSLFALLEAANGGGFDTEFHVSWAPDHVKFFNAAQELQLTLDQTSGSGFASKNKYLFGNINMQIKLVPGDSAGTVTAYYLSSEGSNHDELDFEFLGNKSGEPYVVQTNVYASGKGDREQRIYLWFDPTIDFHFYGVLWTPQQILFMVDSVPIRMFANHKSSGIAYPDGQAMGVYSSLWNGDNWATQGGLVKIDWSHAPFAATYRNFNVQSASSPVKEKEMKIISSEQRNKLEWVKKNYMIYDYCDDKQRYPLPPPECIMDM